MYDFPIGNIVQIKNTAGPVITGLVCGIISMPFSDDKYLVFTDKEYRVNNFVMPFMSNLPGQINRDLSVGRFLIVSPSDITIKILTHREHLSQYFGKNVTGKYVYIPQPGAGFGFVTGISRSMDPNYSMYVTTDDAIRVTTQEHSYECCVHIFDSPYLESQVFRLEDLIILEFPSYGPNNKYKRRTKTYKDVLWDIFHK